jgi:hypothetical protein
MATRIKTKKVKSKSWKQAKAKSGKERCSKGGATHAELKKLVGWKSCLPYAMKSMVQAKVRLRKEREGREVRFFGTRA